MAKKLPPGVKPRPGPDPAPDAKGHPDKAEDLKLIRITVKPEALRGAPSKAVKARSPAIRGRASAPPMPSEEGY